MTVQLITRKFNTSQYHQMNQSNILTEDDRVELINGEIIEMSPIGTKHTSCINRCNSILPNLLGQKVIISIQNPITLNNLSEPQPDIALLKPRADFYENSHPQPQDIFLLIEVVDSSIDYDRDIKIPLYANSNIYEVWLIDINAQLITVYRYPQNDNYQEITTYHRGEKISILSFPDISLQVNAILG